MLALTALSGCDTLNEAANTANQVEVCAKALDAAGFTPDLSNPQKSVEDAQAKAEELRGLAAQTEDATLKAELNAMADEIGSLQVSDVDPVAAATWASQKLDQLNKLNQACSSFTEGGG